MLSAAFLICCAPLVMADTALFAYSGGSPASLVINGTTTLQTDTSANWQGLSQGWWSGDYGNTDDNDNIFVGSIDGLGNINNFFTFAIPTELGPITSVDFVVSRYGSIGLPVTYTLFDVSTDAGTLNRNDGASAAVFNDLGSGISYGSIYVTDTNLPDPLVIHLNSAALSAVSGAQGDYFSIGGTLSGVATPEPGTLGLLGIGLAAIAGVRRRRS